MFYKNIFNKKRIKFFVLVLNLILSSHVNLKADIPAIKGLYTIFDTDVIGIGQALKTKGWIENVYDNAGDDNLAKIVISKFYHKISENEQLKFTEIAPVCELTPELLGQIINYTRRYRLANAEKRVGMTEERDKIAKDWYAKCGDYIKNRLDGHIRNIINRKINDLKKRNEDLDKEIVELKRKRDGFEEAGKKNIGWEAEKEAVKTERENLRKTLKEILKLKAINKENLSQKKGPLRKIDERVLSKEKKEEKIIKEQILDKTKKIAEISEKIKKINVLEREKKRIPELIEAEKAKLSDETLFKKERDDKVEDIQKNTKQILIDLENLAKSQDFIPEMAEAILWAFFEDKFTLGDYKKSFENLLICLKQIEGKKIEIEKKLEFYSAQEYEQFKKEIVELINEQKIEKIIREYDKLNYLNIKVSRDQNFPALVVAKSGSYEDKDGKKTIPFATCFEAAILDTLSILFYNPNTKAYDLSLLPESAKSSDFFKDLIKKVFTLGVNNGEARGQAGENSNFIDPQNINSNYQAWINFIENRTKDLGLEYQRPNGIGKADSYYDLHTTFENLIKVLNATFNLGLEIVVYQDNPEILEINNCNIIEEGGKDLELGLDAKGFWNKIFKFVSKKLSSDLQDGSELKREVEFSCNIEEGPGSFKVEGNTVKVNRCHGKVNVKIKYQDYCLQEYNTEFDLQIDHGHANTTCKARDSKGLGQLYSYSFASLLQQKVVLNKELLTAYILLMNKNLAEKSTLPMENLMFYCMPQKNAEQKVEILKLAYINNLFADKSFDKAKQKHIDGLDSPMALILLENIITSDKNIITLLPVMEKLADKISDSSFARAVIEKILGFDKDIFKLVPLMVKLADKIDSSKEFYSYAARAVIEKILEFDKDISYLEPLIEKLADKISSYEAKEVIEKILEFDKDISGLIFAMVKLADKIDSYRARAVIEKILEFDKDISYLEPLIEKLADKISSYEAKEVIEKILEFDKDISGLIFAMVKLADKIDSHNVKEVIEKILGSNKDIFSLISVIKKLNDKIDNCHIKNFIKNILESNSDILNIKIAAEEVVTKIDGYYVKDFMGMMVMLNKKMSGFMPVIEKLADKIDSHNVKEVIEKILELDKDVISGLMPVIEKLADKIDSYYVKKVIEKILGSNKDIIYGLMPVIVKLADKIDSHNVKEVIEKILELDKDIISKLIPVMAKLADKIDSDLAIEVIEKILGSNKDISSLIFVITKLSDKIDNYHIKNFIKEILESNGDILKIKILAEEVVTKILAEEVVDKTYSFVAKNFIRMMLILNKDISDLISVMEKLADKIGSDGAVEVIEKILESNKKISNLVPVMEKLADKINYFFNARLIIVKILGLDQDISSLVPLMVKLADKVDNCGNVLFIIEFIFKCKGKVSIADKIIEKLSEKITKKYFAGKIIKLFETNKYKPENIKKIMENLAKAK